MNSPEFKNTVCRICLDENVVLDWTYALPDHHDLTYKDCYFKYTQLKHYDDDPFSSMLCKKCSNGLNDAHSLFIKAIDSYNFLLEVNCMNVEDSIIIENEYVSESNDFETVMVEKLDPESVMVEEYEYESFDENAVKSCDEFENYTDNEEIQYQEFIVVENEQKETDIDQGIQKDSRRENGPRATVTKTKPKTLDTNKRKLKEEEISDNENNLTNLKISSYHTRSKKSAQNIKLDYDTQKNNVSKRRKDKSKLNTQNTPCMCSFCSKILHNKYSLRKHERTHLKNRERKASCPICGVKFLEESYIRAHMQIHDEDRVKKHKCEFCDKAFFEKGSLNVHRRIHLGQMIPCTLCSKEFFRKVDLEIHMSSHSASAINGEAKKRSRYMVRCKYCKKEILTTSFKSHTAAHLNQPLMRCSICSKEYFNRGSCREHVKTIHNKKSEELNDYIIFYDKNRLLHLYLRQKADLQLNED